MFIVVSDATCYNIKLVSRVSLLSGRGEERPWERRCHRSYISSLTLHDKQHVSGVQFL